MSAKEAKLAITVSRLTMAVAACLQGLDMLPPEERSSNKALSLMKYALQEMSFHPMPSPAGREFENRLFDQLQAATEAPSMWGEGLSPGEVVH